MFGSSCMYELLLISGVLALGLFERARDSFRNYGILVSYLKINLPFSL